MSKIGTTILLALLLTGNAVTLALLLGERAARRGREIGVAGDGGASPGLEEAIASLDEKLDRLAASLQGARRAESGNPPAAPAVGDDAVVKRLAAIEERLAAMQSSGDEVAAAKVREEREARLRGDEGDVAADELLAEKQYALAGNGYLKFLEHHPEHPEARDLMQKARDAFQAAGSTEKSFAVQQAMLERFPEHRGEDLMALAQMEKDARRLDAAIQHAGEAAEAARIEEDRVWRLLYRAWFVQLRDGDAAGLQAYREVEQLAEGLGMGEKNPGKKVREKIGEIEGRLAQGR